MTTFILNDKEIKTNLPKGLLLLDFIRYHQMLTGTKIGCREGDCGACTILVGEIKNDRLFYDSATSCLMPIGNAEGKHIVTIEGINTNELNSVQQAFAEEGATQCGFCTPGFIVSLTGHCINETSHDYQAAIDAMNGNICRCTGYKSIERAAKKVSDKIQQNEQPALQYAINNNFIPAYFSGIQERLNSISAAPTNGLTHKKRILGGGTDLYVQQHEAMVNEDIDFFFNKENLKGISIKGNTCYMGAAVTVTDIEASAIFNKHFPALQRYIKLVSSTQIRNMATIAGNFVNASPIGDFSIFFLALNAQLHLSNGQTKRQIPLRNFYKGYKQLDKSLDEYIEGFEFELPSGTDYFNFE
ncbi:MAG: FAD binding domain-containing protein, partial [Ferruginibacter sp.]